MDSLFKDAIFEARRQQDILREKKIELEKLQNESDDVFLSDCPRHSQDDQRFLPPSNQEATNEQEVRE